MKILYYSMTDKGKQRDHNEDYFINSEKYSVFMVADGMGGYECGDVASKTALTSVIEYLESTVNGKDFSERTFKYAVEYANSVLNNYKASHPSIKNMGTTFVSFAAGEGGGYAIHVGDSRVYRFRNNKLEQMTKDHSAEQEVLPDFMQNANDGKFASVITRALGTKDSVLADSVKIDCLKNDVLLLCSDGLYSMVKNEEIQSILNTGDSIKIKTEKLIEAANNAGGEDNITVTLAEFSSAENPSETEILPAD